MVTTDGTGPAASRPGGGGVRSPDRAFAILEAMAEADGRVLLSAEQP